jgi:protein SCO1/2
MGTAISLPSRQTALALGAITLIAFIVGFSSKKAPTYEALDTHLMVDGPEQQQVSLIRQDGVPVLWGETSGRPRIVYFGYTFCPDICPMGLSNVAEVVDLTAAQGTQIDPIFISFDTMRDTPDVLEEYVPIFHERLIGLSGKEDQIHKLATSFAAFFEFDPDSADDEFYLMNHTSFIYVVGKDGKVLGHFSDTVRPEKISEFVMSNLAKS